MRTFLYIALIEASALAAGHMSGFAQNPLEPRNFKPPRIAVVDISEVFENYAKKKDMEAKFEIEIRAEEKKFDDLQKRHKELTEELKNVQAGSAKEKELVLQKTQLELDLKNRQKELLKQFQDNQLAALKEIRDEITGEIQRYAVAMEVDLVLEKKVSAESKGNAQAVHWPIVHYVRPELEITGDIVKRLNAKYTKPAADGAKGVGSGGAAAKAAGVGPAAKTAEQSGKK